ncbi:Hsp33 family molecular chaperone HslO [Polymorphobacter fuscus]|uniref:Hsp33 family molecular chaperone HslO n=2 Tax=Sandarakinorhabdus fusca TaxID=1439888 RepID=A0A7C9KW76_9SPHN|nr:Hsp33 family molecular chaperone HslO [Polymorphobacter fuscus]KAB7649030.1 Hsp33 family molecular chaperone HslO [Polymorphobacter fuscus]MQT15706.1 Hsp33 family molecular chaperone HslO [Polymorphobacter fuscus]
MMEGIAPVADRSLGFSVAARNVRGQMVRLDAALNAVLAAHDYPAPLARLLAEALTVTALLGAVLRQDDGQLTVQAQAKNGAVDLLVCDYRAGAIRGYLNFDPDAAITDGMTLDQLFGDGHLAITLHQTAASERYQGIVPLEGASIAEALEGYFANSEQLPTRIKVGVAGDAGTGWIAGGLLVQHLARRELDGERLDVAQLHPDWEHVATLAETTTVAELTDPELIAETLLWRLFHEEEVRITEGATPVRGCRCNPAHIRQVIESFPESERADMRGEDGMIGVDCKFCARVWRIAA